MVYIILLVAFTISNERLHVVAAADDSDDVTREPPFIIDANHACSARVTFGYGTRHGGGATVAKD
jgi:hypothetical protein